MRRVLCIVMAVLVVVVLATTEPAFGVDTSRVSNNDLGRSGLAPVTGSRVEPRGTAERGTNLDASDPWGRPFASVPRATAARPSAANPWSPAPRVSSTAGDPGVVPGYGSPAAAGDISQPKWRLGFYPEETDIGVGIAEVIQGSAAERFGLEVGDVIVSVNGHQVGYVNGTHYDCSNEFAHHATDDGRVTLLVHDHRTKRLVNILVQLDARQQTLRGSISYRERYTLPPDAIVSVELREILRPGAPPITLAQQTIRSTRHVPIPFSIDYDPSQIDRRRQYILHAKISSADRVLFITRQPVPVLSDGSGSEVQLLVESATAFPANGQPASSGSQIAQVTQWFRDYLHREPRASELYVWQAHLDRGGSIYDAQQQLLSTPEFFYQSNADEAQYIRRMHELVLGRPPSQDQLSHWLGRLAHYNNLRSEVVREFLAQQTTRR